MADRPIENRERVCGICGERHDDGPEVEALARFLNGLYVNGLPAQHSNFRHHTADDKDSWRHDARSVLAEVRRLLKREYGVVIDANGEVHCER